VVSDGLDNPLAGDLMIGKVECLSVGGLDTEAALARSAPACYDLCHLEPTALPLNRQRTLGVLRVRPAFHGFHILPKTNCGRAGAEPVQRCYSMTMLQSSPTLSFSFCSEPLPHTLARLPTRESKSETF